MNQITYYSKINTTSFYLHTYNTKISIIDVYEDDAYISNLYKFVDRLWYELLGGTYKLITEEQLIKELNQMLYVLLNKMNYVTKAEDITIVIEAVESNKLDKLNDLLDTVENPFRLITLMRTSFNHRNSLTNWEKAKQKLTEIFKENTYLNADEITSLFNP